MCHFLQNSAISLEKQGFLKFVIKLNPNNDNDSSCTSFCSLACWSDVDINGTIVLVWSKQKSVYMTHITTKKEPKKEPKKAPKKASKKAPKKASKKAKEE